jgi:hypothetical protein
LRGSEAILPDRFSSQSTEKTINLVWAGKALNIRSIQFLSLKESEAIFPDPRGESGIADPISGLKKNHHIALDHRNALWSSESRSPRGIAAGTALGSCAPLALDHSSVGRPTGSTPARAIDRDRRQSRPPDLIGFSEKKTRDRSCTPDARRSPSPGASSIAVLCPLGNPAQIQLRLSGPAHLAWSCSLGCAWSNRCALGRPQTVSVVERVLAPRLCRLLLPIAMSNHKRWNQTTIVSSLFWFSFGA